MKPKLMCVLLVLLLPFAFAAVACSPTQTQWVVRAQDGVAKNANNLTYFYQQLRTQVDKDEAAFVSAVFTDAKMAKAGMLGSTSQPVAFNDTYLEHMQAMLIAGQKGYQEKRNVLDNDYKTAMTNNGYLVEALANIQRLNLAWAGASQQVASQLAQVEAVIVELKAQRASAPK
jgi:hypothetical protein